MIVNIDIDIDHDNSLLTNEPCVISHLTKEKWIVILAAESPIAASEYIIEHHIKSDITTRIKLHDENNVWLVPLTSLVGPCYVVCNKNYCDACNIDNRVISDNTAYVIEPMHMWADSFIQGS